MMKRRALLSLAVASLLVTAFVPRALCEDELEIHFIDVGQGDCILVECPGGRNILVDCGSLGGGDKDDAREYLLGQLGPKKPRLHAVVITHPDRDHYNWLPDVLEDVQVDRVLAVGKAKEHSASGCKDWIDDHSLTVLKKTIYNLPGKPSKLFGTGDVEFFVLAANTPTKVKRKKKNTRSIVLMVSYGEFDALLMGDATDKTEAKILGRYKQHRDWLDVELLKIGHHGSLSSTSDEWAEAAQPEMAVVCCDYSNTFEHPRKTVIERLTGYTDDEPTAHSMRWGIGKGKKAKLVNVSNFREAIYSTATNGTILVTTDGEGYSVEYRVTHDFDGN